MRPQIKRNDRRNAATRKKEFINRVSDLGPQAKAKAFQVTRIDARKKHYSLLI